MAKAPRSGQRSEGPEPDTLQIAAAESGRDIEKLRQYHAELGAILSRLDGERGPVDKAPTTSAGTSRSTRWRRSSR